MREMFQTDAAQAYLGRELHLERARQGVIA